MLNQELNTILKEMWKLDDKKISGQDLTPEEDTFYTMYIQTIKKYYFDQNTYWQNK